MIRYQLLIGLALLVGVAVGYFMRGERSPAENPAAAVSAAPARRGPVADEGHKASLAALRRRIAELERRLAEKGVNMSNAVAEVARIVPEGRDRHDPRAWLENLRKIDPERYVQMTNRFARWRRNRAEHARSAIDFLSSVDTSRMSPEAQKTHSDLQNLIARREELEEQLHREDLSAEEREQILREMRQTHGEMMRLNGEERRNLIAETAHALGFEGDDAKEVAATIQDVIQATSSGFGPPHGGGRPPHGGGRPPEPPPQN